MLRVLLFQPDLLTQGLDDEHQGEQCARGSDCPLLPDQSPYAAFPDRFELRPLVPTLRDAVTGEFILPQVIEAAKSGPESGGTEQFMDAPFPTV